MGAEPQVDPLVGRVIGGKFEIESLIGRGGMGAVYRARQVNLKRAVAIKVLRTELLDDPTYAARFKREANAASQLDHPNLMRVIDFGEDDNLLYIAMEFIDGKALHSIMRMENTLEPVRVVDLVGQLLAGLAVMHDEGIIHRDLKPENVMVVRGKDDDGHTVEIVKLCDFGIAKQVAPKPEPGADPVTYTATLTATGSLVGTPDYMSPEQAKGERVDGRSDLYSVGVILYQMIAGRLPFKSANSMKVLLAHISEQPAPPSKWVESVDPALEEICLRALAKDPEQRYANAREMRLALRDALGLRDSSVLGARRMPSRSSVPPARGNSSNPPVADKAAETLDVVTRRGSERHIAALRQESSPPSGSGVVPKPPRDGGDSTGTLASGASAPQAAKTPDPKTPDPPKVTESSVAPPTTPATREVAPAPNRTVPALIALVIALLGVIAFLVARAK